MLATRVYISQQSCLRDEVDNGTSLVRFLILLYSKQIGHVEVGRPGELQPLNHCNSVQGWGVGGAWQSLATVKSNRAVG